MNAFNAIFSIVDEKNCPLYEVEEKLTLSDKTLSCPENKEVCLILVRDMTQILFQLIGEKSDDPADYGTVYTCSGCTGLIKFSRIITAENKKPSPATGASIDSAVEKAYGRIVDSAFLRALPADRIHILLPNFKEIRLEKGATLIRKGEQNLNLYIVIEGELIVEDNGIVQANIVEGEICGEMSYLGADVAVSTVKAVTDTKVLAIAGDVFGNLLGENASVQAFMAKVLAVRLRKTSVARSKEFESCMSGRIDEIVPAELFQIFHMHQKTGVLTMELPNGTANVSFREGCIINAKYNGKNNQEAIFLILGEKKGVYRFTTGLTPQQMKAGEIGDFMMLLMEGVKRVDEDRED